MELASGRTATLTAATLQAMVDGYYAARGWTRRAAAALRV